MSQHSHSCLWARLRSTICREKSLESTDQVDQFQTFDALAGPSTKEAPQDPEAIAWGQTSGQLLRMLQWWFWLYTKCGQIYHDSWYIHNTKSWNIEKHLVKIESTLKIKTMNQPDPKVWSCVQASYLKSSSLCISNALVSSSCVALSKAWSLCASWAFVPLNPPIWHDLPMPFSNSQSKTLGMPSTWQKP